MEETKQIVDLGCIVGASILDLSKDIDTIINVKLISKLTSYGVHRI